MSSWLTGIRASWEERVDFFKGSRALIAGAAFAAVLVAGTAAGCASGSLAFQPVAGATPGAVDHPSAGGASGTGQTSPGAAGAPAVGPSGGGTARNVSGGPAVVSANRADLLPQPVATAVLARGITVTGTGQVTARPDEAIVTVGVQTRAPTARDAQEGNNRTMQAVLAAIKALGIPDQDIQTTGVFLYPVIEHGNTISGYNAANNVTVLVEKVDQAGAVLDAAVKAGANTAGNVRFAFKDETALRNRALAAAATDARSKADAIASAMGLKITGVESISEGSVVIPRPLAAPGMAAPAAAPSVPIEPGQQTITATVTAVFGF